MEITGKMTTLDIRPYERSDFFAVKTLYELAGVFNEITDLEEHIETKLMIDPDSLYVAENDKAVIGCTSFFRTSDAFVIDKLAPLKKADKLIRLHLLLLADKKARSGNHSEIILYLPDRHEVLDEELQSAGYRQREENIWVKEDLYEEYSI